MFDFAVAARDRSSVPQRAPFDGDVQPLPAGRPLLSGVDSARADALPMPRQKDHSISSAVALARFRAHRIVVVGTVT
jgi:hypothetical protein